MFDKRELLVTVRRVSFICRFERASHIPAIYTDSCAKRAIYRCYSCCRTAHAATRKIEDF
ncbi:hypothetical protein BZM27_38495 [Paraburkholderia steynii]|uniref:Uncharacterized protein n=1 Tax=Paraburkholderia steynii TaxID=1245441 RepID=A0A4R0XD43_9BURK|nr:hypothetical protein BZM27_38495 [Paraburkholderia steynii]